MKKVLGLIVSQRRTGNSELLVKEIMSSIPEDCHKELIRLTDLKIEPCKACYKCLQADQDCPIKDDFNFVLNKIKEADAVIIGVPIYILGPHGYYKMLIDRLLAAEKYAPYAEGKPCVIVIPYGIKGWEGYSKAASLTMPRMLKMKLMDCWQVHSALPGESLLNTENVKYARSLGMGLFDGHEYNSGSRECTHCGSDLFRLLEGNRVECPICGSQGILKNNNIPDFTDSKYCRFSNKGMKEHFEWLSEMKHRFFSEKGRLKEVQKVYANKDWWIKP